MEKNHHQPNVEVRAFRTCIILCKIHSERLNITMSNQLYAAKRMLIFDGQVNVKNLFNE